MEKGTKIIIGTVLTLLITVAILGSVLIYKSMSKRVNTVEIAENNADEQIGIETENEVSSTEIGERLGGTVRVVSDTYENPTEILSLKGEWRLHSKNSRVTDKPVVVTNTSKELIKLRARTIAYDANYNVIEEYKEFGLYRNSVKPNETILMHTTPWDVEEAEYVVTILQVEPEEEYLPVNVTAEAEIGEETETSKVLNIKFTNESDMDVPFMNFEYGYILFKDGEAVSVSTHIGNTLEPIKAGESHTIRMLTYNNWDDYAIFVHAGASESDKK